MASREEVFRELGLMPAWRRRHAIASGEPAAHPLADAPSADTIIDRVRAPLRAAPSVSAPAGARAASLAPAATPATVDAMHDRALRIATLDWSSFAADVDACTACGLCKTRAMSVPGVGDVNAQWMFVGEAPGAEEDARGEPFVGQAGRLLDSMLRALGMHRAKEVYIANVLKCRPPQNRTPEPLEIAACQPYLDRQIALIKPKLIVALGKSAAATLLGLDSSIASMRGRVHRYRGVPLIVTYHPAYLLRNLPDKAKAWEDLCLARATLRGQGAAGTLNMDGAAPNS